MDHPVRRLNITFQDDNNSFHVSTMKNLLNCFDYHSRKTVEILLLKCGDINHMLHTSTVVSSSESKVELRFTLNDSVVRIARNLLLLNIICSPMFNPNKSEDMKFLWDIWYNMHWSEQTKNRFFNLTKDLLAKNPASCMTISKSDMDEVEKIMSFWIIYVLEGDMKRKMENAERERRETLLLDHSFRFKSTGKVPLVLTDLSKEYSDILGPNLDLLPSQAKIHALIEKEVSRYHSTGDTGPIIDNPFCVNPTLIHPCTGKWTVHFATPFHSYCPLPLESLNTETKSVSSICLEILTTQVQGFLQLMKENRLKIHFVVEDAIQMLMQSPDYYDIIDTSNLADTLGLANILVMAPPRMNEESLLLTETYFSTKTISSALYLEEVIGFQVEMFPAVFGLRLMLDLAFGSDTPLNGKYRSCYTFRWARVPVNRPRPPLSLQKNTAVKECLIELGNRCFQPPGIRWTGGVEYYTPLTLTFTLRSMMSRYDFNLREALEFLNPGRIFALAWRIASDWVSGHKLQQMIIQCKPSEDLLLRFRTGRTNFVPRIVMMNEKFYQSAFLEQQFVEAKGCHFIDNVEVDIYCCEDIPVYIYYRFLVPESFIFFDEDMLVFGVDNVSMMALNCSIQEWVMTPRKGYPLVPLRNSENFNGRIEKFTEDAVKYEMFIRTKGESTIKEAKIATSDDCFSKSTNDVTIEFPQGCAFPLRLTVGHAVLTNDIEVGIRGRCLSLKMLKAANQLWPMDVVLCPVDQRRYPQRMILWKTHLDKKLLYKHLKLQFTLSQWDLATNSKTQAKISAVVELRGLIRHIFLENEQGNHLFAVQSKIIEKKPRAARLLIRTHQNILCSGPLLIPFLAVTMLERSEIQKLFNPRDISAICDMEV